MDVSEKNVKTTQNKLQHADNQPFDPELEAKLEKERKLRHQKFWKSRVSHFGEGQGNLTITLLAGLCFSTFCYIPLHFTAMPRTRKYLACYLSYALGCGGANFYLMNRREKQVAEKTSAAEEFLKLNPHLKREKPVTSKDLRTELAKSNERMRERLQNSKTAEEGVKK